MRHHLWRLLGLGVLCLAARASANAPAMPQLERTEQPAALAQPREVDQTPPPLVVTAAAPAEERQPMPDRDEPSPYREREAILADPSSGWELVDRAVSPEPLENAAAGEPTMRPMARGPMAAHYAMPVRWS